MCPWSARSAWAVGLGRNCSLLALTVSLVCSPLKVTPLDAAQNWKDHYSDKKGTLRVTRKKHLTTAFRRAVTLQKPNKIIKLNVILWVLSFSLSTFLFANSSCACVKLCIQPRVQLLLYCFADSVQSFGTHGPSTDSIRLTQGSDGCVQKHSGVRTGPCMERDPRLWAREAH